MDLATRKMIYYGLLGLLIAGSTIAVFRVAPQMIPVQFLTKDGTINIYMGSIQPDIQGNTIASTSTLPLVAGHVSGRPSGDLLSLNVTIDSVTIHANDSGTGETTRSTSFTFDVLKPFNVSTLIVSSKVPVEDVTMVSLHVSKAVASVAGISGVISVKVPSEELKIPVSPVVHVSAQNSISIVISGTAHVVFRGNNNITLTPELHARGPSGSQ